LIEAANFLGSVLDYGFAKRDLAVSGHDDFVVAADAEDGGGADEAGRGGSGTFGDCCY
jgi:hypothetical protein